MSESEDGFRDDEIERLHLSRLSNYSVATVVSAATTTTVNTTRRATCSVLPLPPSLRTAPPGALPIVDSWSVGWRH